MCLKRLSIVALLSATILSTGTHANDLWTLGDQSDVLDQGVISARLIQPDFEKISKLSSGDYVKLPLIDGTPVPIIVSSVRELGAQRRIIVASVRGIPTSSVIIAMHGEGLSASVQMGDGASYRVHGIHTGALQLEAVDADELPWCSIGDEETEHQQQQHLRMQGGLDLTDAIPAGVGSCDDGTIIDVFVPYSEEAKNEAGGTANILADIDFFIASANEALTYAEVNTQMRLVHAREYQGLGGISLGQLTNGTDGVGDDIHAVRDAYEADQVAFVKAGGGGVANGLWSFDTSFADTAFCINGRTSAPFIIAHEIGHNLGCCHARGDGGGCPGEGGLLYPYSNGHRFFGDGGTQWRSVMAYNPGNWTAFYSNPDVNFDGQPTGIAEGESDSADNAKTINLSAPLVATWRCSDTTCMDLDLPPDAPDCDGNGVPDGCDIALGNLVDANGDGIPDICQCVGDLNDSGAIDVGDLLALLAAWGPCDDCDEDLTGDDNVNVKDLLLMLGAWGDCI